MKRPVSIVRCKTYNYKDVEIAVRKAFDLIGGLSSFIDKEDKVLIKPNMLSGRPPEDNVNTHPEVVRAVVRLVKECGGYPAIGDNPGGSLNAEEAYQSSGMARVAYEEGIECLKSNDVRIVNGLPISSYFFDYDKIISLPKMKTHSLMLITGAIKNMFGAVSGLNKSECHRRFPLPEDFVHILVDAFTAVRPDLVLMDGIVAMDGDGPASGRLRHAGILIAGEDSVAVDSVFSRLIGITPEDILTIKEAVKRGLGQCDLNNIEIIGERMEDVYIKGFRLPRSRFILRIPGFVINFLAGLVKFGPFVDRHLCRKCNACLEACPNSAIFIDKKGYYTIDYHRCIRCMCCHEVCPHRAIGLRRNILARLVGL